MWPIVSQCVDASILNNNRNGCISFVCFFHVDNRKKKEDVSATILLALEQSSAKFYISVFVASAQWSACGCYTGGWGTTIAGTQSRFIRLQFIFSGTFIILQHLYAICLVQLLSVLFVYGRRPFALNAYIVQMQNINGRHRKKKHSHKFPSTIMNIRMQLLKMEINFNRFFSLLLLLSFSRAYDFSHYSQQIHVSIP